MQILPAIDLRDGKVVRLYQGDYDKMTVFGDRPLIPPWSLKGRGRKTCTLLTLKGQRTESRGISI